MKTVAVSTAFNQAIADFSAEAASLLRRARAGETDDVRAEAGAHLRRLREFVRCTGVELNELPAWNEHIASWRALAALAGSADQTAYRAR